MDELETTPKEETSTLDRVKTAAEVIVITHTVIAATIGLVGLAKEAKAALKERREAKAKKDQQEEE